MRDSGWITAALATRPHPVLATNARRVMATSILARAAALCEKLQFAKLSCVVVVTSDAEDVLTGFVIAEQLRSSLLLVSHHFLRHIPELAAQSGAGAVIQAGEVLPRAGNTQAEGTAEILLLTSGTTGMPKIVRHSWASLSSRIRVPAETAQRVWLLTYLPSGFAGLQVLLTAALAGELVVWADPPTFPKAIEVAALSAVTHVSCTPTFLRGFLAAGADQRSIPAVRQLTLGGEAADQPLLNAARTKFFSSKISHIYATSEAGALFSVHDGREGFPAEWLQHGVEGVELKVEDGTLRAKSSRAMIGYLGQNGREEWMDTGDVVAIRGDRVLFAGRADRRINVAGYKISPEDVERAILAVPGVVDVTVRAVRSPITGYVLVADIVPDTATGSQDLRERIIASLRDTLAPYQLPRLWNFVPQLETSAAGKKLRDELPTQSI
jgi:acyl-coenzyme A synthetase/AMP-(fatty) acid ligase